MMNVNMQNTNQVLQKTSMVGFLPQVAPKEVVQREDSSHSFLDDLESGHGFEKEAAPQSHSPLQPSPQQMQNAQRASQGQASTFAQPRNRISQNTTFNQSWSADAEEEEAAGKSGGAQAGARAAAAPRAGQQQGADRAENRYSLGYGTGQTGESHHSEGTQAAGKSAPMEAPKFDTGSMIQIQYLANSGMNLVANVVMSAAEKALSTKEWFLRNFFRLVDSEYKQYVKSDDAVYSRKNLREILAALGETINPFSSKNKKWRKERGLENKGFDKLNQRLAGRTLKIFDEPPEEEQEQQQEPLEIVW